MEKVIRHLPVKLTEDDIIEMAQQIGVKKLEVENLEADKKSFVAANKLKTDALESELTQLCKCVREGEEEREIQCVWNWNQPVRGMKELVRLDTQEVVEDKDMSAYDKERAAEMLQMRMPLDEPATP